MEDRVENIERSEIKYQGFKKVNVRPKKDMQHKRVYVIPEGGSIEKASKNVPKGSTIMHRDAFYSKYLNSIDYTAKYCGQVAGIRIYDTHLKKEVNYEALKEAKKTQERLYGHAYIREGYKPGTNIKAEYKDKGSEALPGYPGKGNTKGMHVVNGRWVKITEAEKKAKENKNKLY